MALDPRRVPLALLPLLPFAEKWGIGDDFGREAAVDAASLSELEALVHCIDDISDEDFYGWLAGPAGKDPNPSDEYVALACLGMARESAKLELRRRQRT
jgi:hypothetical protein